jgi:hypothetical protein
VSEARRWAAGRAARAWIEGPYFPRQLRDFLLLWMVFKAANVATAVIAGVPPLGLRPATELAALAFECLGLFVFLRRAHETVPTANLGLSLPLVLAPFAVLHTILALLLAAFA